MSYLNPPGSPGYPPAQQPTTQFAAPTQQFGKLPDAAPAAEGPSKLPVYLTAAVAALGLAVYLSSYGPLSPARRRTPAFSPTLLDLGVVASLLGRFDRRCQPAAQAEGCARAGGGAVGTGLPARDQRSCSARRRGVDDRVGALPDHRVQRAAGDRRCRGAAVRRGRHHPACAAAHVRAASSSTASTGLPGRITDSLISPAHRTSRAQQLRPGYPSPYPGGYPGGPPAGGFSGGPQAGPPTPPTGFPAYGQPPSSNAPTTQVP